MKVGTDRVSTEQKDLLRHASSGDAESAAWAFLRLVQDSEIAAGEETVHPEWLEVYKKQSRTLGSSLPKEFRNQIRTFFDSLPVVDNQLSSLNLSKLKTAFLLGAGASKPSPSDIPTVKELLPQLLDRGRRLDRDDVTKLADFCRDREIDNIEDLLTAAQLATFSSRNSNILRLLNYLLYGGEGASRVGFLSSDVVVERSETGRVVRRREATAASVSSVAFLQDTLQVLFGLLASTMLPAKPNTAHEAIAKFVKEHPESWIVTTNYDCCMDIALEDVQLAPKYCLEFVNHQGSEKIENTEKATLIKLHGSLNWYYCETCQSVQRIDIRETIESYLKDRGPYSVIGICKHCGGQRRGLLVPPLAMKFDVAPPLTPLITEARSAFESSSAIVVVGFSFAEADVYISRMLSKSMQRKPDQKLVIIDPSFEVADRVRRKFQSSIPKFDPKRIIGIAGDCSDALPKLLAGDYLKEGARTTQEQRKR
jgi:NAD-dependent SIR2 family protein deacetylase